MRLRALVAAGVLAAAMVSAAPSARADDGQLANPRTSTSSALQ